MGMPGSAGCFEANYLSIRPVTTRASGLDIPIEASQSTSSHAPTKALLEQSRFISRPYGTDCRALRGEFLTQIDGNNVSGSFVKPVRHCSQACHAAVC